MITVVSSKKHHLVVKLTPGYGHWASFYLNKIAKQYPHSLPKGWVSVRVMPGEPIKNATLVVNTIPDVLPGKSTVTISLAK